MPSARRSRYAGSGDWNAARRKASEERPPVKRNYPQIIAEYRQKIDACYNRVRGAGTLSEWVSALSAFESETDTVWRDFDSRGLHVWEQQITVPKIRDRYFEIKNAIIGVMKKAIKGYCETIANEMYVDARRGKAVTADTYKRAVEFEVLNPISRLPKREADELAQYYAEVSRAEAQNFAERLSRLKRP